MLNFIYVFQKLKEKYTKIQSDQKTKPNPTKNTPLNKLMSSGILKLA